MTRKITFPNVCIEQGSRVWRNSETGVEIIKGVNFKEVGLYYVCAPSTDEDGRKVISWSRSLAEARKAAVAVARGWRLLIGDAYLEAHEAAILENEGRQIREANQVEQITEWLGRHDITEITASNILAAREVDHAEALAEHSSRYWERATDGMARVPAF